jgi:hypothetical protein
MRTFVHVKMNHSRALISLVLLLLGALLNAQGVLFVLLFAATFHKLTECSLQATAHLIPSRLVRATASYLLIARKTCLDDLLVLSKS